MSRPASSAKPFVFLAIEDNPGDARLLRELLRSSTSGQFDLVYAENLGLGLGLLGRRACDGILLSLGLRNLDGIEVVRRVRATFPEMPTVVLTERENQSLAENVIRLGAQDCLIKGEMNARSLARALRFAIERQAITNDRERAGKTRDLLNRSAVRISATEELTDALEGVLKEVCGFTGRAALEASNLEVAPGKPPVRLDLARILEDLDDDLIGNASKLCSSYGRTALRAATTPHCVELRLERFGPAENQAASDRVGEANAIRRSSADLRLASASWIMEFCDGRLHVFSRPGEGTVFSIELPAAVADLEEPDPIPSSMFASSPGIRMRRVLLIDDHAMVLDSIEELLRQDGNFEIVAKANSGHEGIERAKALRPELTLVDILLPDLSGIEVIRQIVAFDPAIQVVALTANSEEESLVPALEAGASGYILKTASPEEFFRVVRGCACGEAEVGPHGHRLLVDRYRELRSSTDTSPLGDLNDRDKQLLGLVALGFNSREIGRKLFLSPQTVDSYRSRLQRRFGLSTRSEVVRFAVNTGLLGKE